MRGAPAPPAGKVPPQPQTPRFPRSKRARSSPNPTRLLHPPLRTRRAPAPPTSATTGRPRNRLSPSPSAAPSEEDARANPPEKGRRSPNPTRLLRPLFRTPKAGAEQPLPLPRVHPPTRPTRHHPRPPAPYYKKGAPSGHAAAPSLFPQPRPATAPRTTLVPAASHPGFPALRYLPISSEPPSVLVPAASRPAPRTPAPPTSFPAAPPPPAPFPAAPTCSNPPLSRPSPAGIGVAQTGIPVIPRSAQSAIFAPSDPSPDIRIPWQTSSNA